MMRKFAVFDIDGTLIRWQLYHAVVNRLAAEGALLGNSHEKIRAARRQWKNRADNFSNYEDVLVGELLSALPNLDPKHYSEVVQSIWDEYHDQTYVYTRDLIKELRAADYFLLIISGSPIEIVELLAKKHGFDDYAACVFERNQHGHFTGQVKTPVHDKKTTLKKLVEKHDLSWQDSIAIGDSASDIVMLDLVKKPIAFNPDQKLFEAASKRGWSIVVERKDVVYRLRGGDGIIC
jgi:HAD superfamily hydrolase (TIGR01490 family)